MWLFSLATIIANAELGSMLCPLYGLYYNFPHQSWSTEDRLLVQITKQKVTLRKKAAFKMSQKEPTP